MTNVIMSHDRDRAGRGRTSDWRSWVIGTWSLVILTMLAAPATVRADDEAQRQFTFAYRLLERGELDLAKDAFVDFVRRFEKDMRVPDAVYYLALLSRQRGDLLMAREWITRVKQPHRVPVVAVHLLRGQIMLESQNAAEAVRALEAVNPAELPDAETRATWHYLRGLAYDGVTNLPAAAEQFDKATEAESAIRQMALMELGRTRAKLDQKAAAIEALRLAAEGSDAEIAAAARSLAAELAYAGKQYDLAADLYGELVTRHQASKQFKTALIGRLRALLAAERFDQLLQQYPSIEPLLDDAARGEAWFMLGAAQVRQGKHAEAVATLTRFFEKHGSRHADSPRAGYLMAIALYHTDAAQFDAWMARADQALPEMPGRAELRYLQAQSAMKQNRHKEAIDLLTPLVQDEAGPYAQRGLLERAGLYEKLEQPQLASADYAMYVKRYGEDPFAASAGRRSIDLAFNAGQYGKVLELAGQWLSQPDRKAQDVAAVRFKLAIAQIKVGDTVAAQELLEQMLAGPLDDELATLADYYRGLLLAAQIDVPAGAVEAGAALTEHQRTSLDQAVAALQSAVGGKLPEAQAVEAYALLARLQRLAGRDGEAVKAFEQLRRRQSVDRFDPATAVWVGRRLLEGDAIHEALSWLTPLTDRPGVADPVRAEAMFRVAQGYHQMCKWKDAAEAYRKLIAFSKGYGDQGRLGLAQSLGQLGQVEEALAEYDGLVNVSSSRIAATALFDSAILHRDMAERYRTAGDAEATDRELREARRRLNRLDILYPLPQLDPLPQRTLVELGMIALKQNEPDKARELFQRLAEEHPAHAWTPAARAELLLLDGKKADAVFLLTKLHRDSADAAILNHAEQRLNQLGAKP